VLFASARNTGVLEGMAGLAVPILNNPFDPTLRRPSQAFGA
jgi:hypothetical protein